MYLGYQRAFSKDGISMLFSPVFWISFFLSKILLEKFTKIKNSRQNHPQNNQPGFSHADHIEIIHLLEPFLRSSFIF